MAILGGSSNRIKFPGQPRSKPISSTDDINRGEGDELLLLRHPVNAESELKFHWERDGFDESRFRIGGSELVRDRCCGERVLIDDYIRFFSLPYCAGSNDH